MADSEGSRSPAVRGPQVEATGAYSDPASARAAISRGRFLSGVTAGLGGLIGAAVAMPAVGFAFGPSFGGEKWYWTNVGPVDQFTPAGTAADPKSWKFTPVKFERTPTGGQLERRVAFVARYGKGDADWAVISNTCMHLGCPVQATGIGFGCPCHGGQYDKGGRRTAGPPVRPLNRYEHQVAGGNLLIGRPFAAVEKNGRVEIGSEWKDPGEPVQGLLSILYPAPPR